MNVMQQFLLFVFIGTTIVVFFIEDVISLILRRVIVLSALQMAEIESDSMWHVVKTNKH